MNKYADRRASAVAIVSPDPLLGALIGAAAELLGYRAAFPRPGESAIGALRRARAAFILIDCEDPSANDEALLGRALMTEARPFLFGSAERCEAFRAIAARFGVSLIVLPRDIDSLAAILTRRTTSSEQLAD